MRTVVTSTDTTPDSNTGNKTGAVSMRLAAGWGVGSLGAVTMLNGVSVILLYFLVNFAKIEPVIAGALLFGSKLLDVVTDPPMGIISDRTRSRFGKRRPYLFGASFFCGISFALLFNVPEASVNQTYIYMGFALALFALSYTAFQVPYMAMPAEMTDDYHARTRIMSWRVIFMTVGNIAGFAGVPALVSAFGEGRDAYGQMGMIVGVVITLAMLACFFATAGARQTAISEIRTPLKQHLQWLSQNRPLLILMGTKIAIYTGLSANIAVALFFLSSVLKMGPAQLGIYGGVSALTTILCMPACAWIARRIGKKKAYTGSLIGFSFAILTWLLATPDESMVVFVARAVLIGIFGAGAHLYGQSMLVDTFAWDYKLFGVRREGVLAASFSFVEKACLALGPLIIGVLLSSMGFDKDLATSADQSPSAIRAMYLGFIWIPLLCQIVSISLLRFYALDEKALETD
jgi:GPH family glycoside/pentoside/hexuronide:cation symporter